MVLILPSRLLYKEGRGLYGLSHLTGEGTIISHHLAPAAATDFVYRLIENHHPSALQGVTQLSYHKYRSL